MLGEGSRRRVVRPVVGFRDDDGAEFGRYGLLPHLTRGSSSPSVTRQKRARFAAITCLASSAALFSPGCGGGLPRAPAVPGDEGFHAVGDTTPPGMDEGPPVGLTLAPGDVVSLRMQSIEVEIVEGLTVDARGVLHVPLAGDVEVGGIPLTEAEQAIEQAMRRYVSTLRVTVILTDPQGHQASVIGAVSTQGRVPIVPGMRVADLLAAAGGLATGDEGGVVPLADLHAARIVRGGETLPVSVALAVEGDPRHNVRVAPGDHLYVPPQLGSLISVIGEVGAARVLAHRPGLRLSQALAMAGGITRDANGGDIRIVRGPSESPSVYRAAIDHVAAGDHPDPVLAPGDIVYVGSSALADFRDFTSAIAPIISVLATGGITVGLTASRP